MNSQSSRRNILGTKEITKATKNTTKNTTKHYKKHYKTLQKTLQNTTKKDYKKRFCTDSARILSIPRGIRMESAHSVRIPCGIPGGV